MGAGRRRATVWADFDCDIALCVPAEAPRLQALKDVQISDAARVPAIQLGACLRSAQTRKHLKLELQLKPLMLVYPCLAAFFTFTLWLLFFS